MPRSGSLTEAVTARPIVGWVVDMLTEPSSSTFVTVIVTACIPVRPSSSVDTTLML